MRLAQHFRSFSPATAFVLCACISSSSASFDAYQGERKPDNELALIAERDPTAGLETISKDGAVIWKREASYAEQSVKGSVNRQQVKLTPGRYKIASLLWCASDYAYETSGFKNPNYLGIRHTDDVELVAGHAYEIRGENVGYLCLDGARLWIEDTTEGKRLQTISSSEQTFSR